MITQHVLETQIDYTTILNVPSITDVANTTERDALSPSDADMVKYPDNTLEIYCASDSSWTTFTNSAVTVPEGAVTINPYSSSISYGAFSMVEREGSFYIALKPTTAVPPAAPWKLCTLNFKYGDTSDPVITLNGSNPMSVNSRNDYEEPGATAAAGEYDLTDCITITEELTGANELTVTYTVTSPECLTSTETRIVNLTNGAVGDEPVITLTGANPQTVALNGTYTELGATANDTEDGDITANIVTDSSAVNTAVEGSYTVTYTVTDSDNNTVTVTRTVLVGNNVVMTAIDGYPKAWLANVSYPEESGCSNCFGTYIRFALSYKGATDNISSIKVDGQSVPITAGPPSGLGYNSLTGEIEDGCAQPGYGVRPKWRLYVGDSNCDCTVVVETNDGTTTSFSLNKCVAQSKEYCS